MLCHVPGLGMLQHASSRSSSSSSNSSSSSSISNRSQGSQLLQLLMGAGPWMLQRPNSRRVEGAQAGCKLNACANDWARSSHQHHSCTESLPNLA